MQKSKTLEFGGFKQTIDLPESPHVVSLLVTLLIREAVNDNDEYVDSMMVQGVPQYCFHFDFVII